MIADSYKEGDKMDHLLEQIREEHYHRPKETQSIRRYYQYLLKRLPANDRRILLRIVDGKDLLIEEAASQNFERGLCLGVQLAFDMLKVNESDRSI